jgi:hypothetical protein
MTHNAAQDTLLDLLADGYEYVTYGHAQSDLGTPIPILEAIKDVIGMDVDAWGNGTLLACDSKGKIYGLDDDAK